MGCALAAELALRRPDAVEALLLFNAPVYRSPESRRRVIARQNALTWLSLKSPLAAWLVCEAAVCVPRPVMTRVGRQWLRPDVPPEAASDYFRHTFDSYYTSLMNLVMGRDLLEVLASVARPVRVVQGARDDLVDPQDALAWPPNVQVSTLEGMDHTALLLHHPGRAAALVRELLADWRGPLSQTREPLRWAPRLQSTSRTAMRSLDVSTKYARLTDTATRVGE